MKPRLILMVPVILCVWSCQTPNQGDSAPSPTHRLSENFIRAEFACPHCGQVHVDPVLVGGLQDLRDRLGRPVFITSGYRCRSHNRAVGGASNSLHMEGMAADIVVRGMSPAELYEAVRQVPVFRDGGIGVYGGRGFVHVDLRPHSHHWGIGSTFEVPSSTLNQRTDSPNQPSTRNIQSQTGSWSLSKEHRVEILSIIMQNQESFLGLILALISLIKLTAWGRSKSEALDTIVQVIETQGLNEAKSMVAAQGRRLSTGAKDAIENSVNKADRKKRQAPLMARIIREIFRIPSLKK